MTVEEFIKAQGKAGTTDLITFSGIRVLEPSVMDSVPRYGELVKVWRVNNVHRCLIRWDKSGKTSQVNARNLTII